MDSWPRDGPVNVETPVDSHVPGRRPRGDVLRASAPGNELCNGAGANSVRPAKSEIAWRARAVGFQGHPQTDRQQLVSDRTKQANKRTHCI